MKAIYKIQNLKTGDFYIGSSVNYTYRKWCHIRDLNQGKHKNPILQNSWRKYGESAFLFTVIEEISDIKILIEREQFYLDTLKPRYNICKVAGSPLGVKHTYEARLHMSLAHKGKKLKDMGHVLGCKCTVCHTRSGKDHPNFGKKRKTETIQKLSRPIIQLDLHENIIREWISATEAGRELIIHPAHISACCRFERKTTGGFKWKFKT